jgi:hypothetical protein
MQKFQFIGSSDAFYEWTSGARSNEIGIKFEGRRIESRGRITI